MRERVLKSAPKQVTMTFTEAVGVSDDSFRVLSPENRRVSTGDTAARVRPVPTPSG